MKNLDKTIVMASLTVAGLLGINASANADTYRDRQDVNGAIIMEPGANHVRDARGAYYNNGSANNQVRDSSGNYYRGPVTNASTTTTSPMVHNSQARVSMNDAAAPKTRQQVLDELAEARKHGLLDYSENEYPQKWADYQNHKAYGTPYHK